MVSSTRLQIGPAATPKVIKQLLVWTITAFCAQWILMKWFPGLPGELPGVVRVFGLSPERFWSGMVWQPLTSMFLHADLMHLLGNLFFLWMFGSPVADQMSRGGFLRLYLGGGALSGLITAVLSLPPRLLGVDIWLLAWSPPTIGASGGVFVVLATFCFLWPNRVISLLFLPLSLAARWLLPLEFLTEFGFALGAVNHAAHLSGAFVGWLFVRRRARFDALLSPMTALLIKISSIFAGRRRRALSVVPPESDSNGPVFH